MKLESVLATMLPAWIKLGYHVVASKGLKGMCSVYNVLNQEERLNPL